MPPSQAVPLRFLLLSVCLFLCALPEVLAGIIHGVHLSDSKPDLLIRQEDRGNDTVAPLLAGATPADIENARKIVKAAIEESSKRNKARLDKPARNIYKLAPKTSVGGSSSRVKRDAEDEPVPALLTITPEIAAAAALVAEADAKANATGGPNVLQKRGTFWMEHIERKGAYPSGWGGSSGYKVFRNVKSAPYNAKGDGVTDDTEAIRKAIMEGDRCAEKCNGATNKNAIVYFPPGRYLVSSTIQVIFGTQLIGDKNDRPQIIASAGFVGLGVLSTNEYVPDGGTGPDGNAKQWYINTGRFYSQIRNFVIDITRTDPNAYVCAIHYQVAQATSLQDVELVAKTGTTQQGMFSENGSGGVMSDVTFRGGNFGFYGGNQQFTAQRMTFIGCKTAVQIIWDWGWIWKSVKVSGGEVGFRLLGEGGQGTIGSVAFVDSTFENVGQAIVIGGVESKPGSGTTGLIIENCAFSGVTNRVVTSSNTAVLSGSGSVTHWVLGPTYSKGERSWANGVTSLSKSREASLVSSGSGGLPVSPYFERKRPQYEDRDASAFIHVKDYGAKGDGSSDDTAAVQRAFDAAADGSKILFVDNGVYILTGTVTIPKNAKVVGECWASFVARGSYFSDADDPKVVLRVGKDGDIGNVELQDFIVLTKGGTAGAILIEWNVQAERQGSAALWDVHARVGGATGTDQNPSDCPPITGGTNPAKCQAAHMLMHITPKASGLFDNMWLWIADHLIDDPLRDDDSNNMDQLSIYVSRGLLIESKRPVWLYGTASEHAVMYQYNFYKAKNVYAGMLQTEPPYFQPTPKAPAPFKAGKYPSDPDYSCKGGDFDGCDTAWAVVITGSENIMIGAAGTYSWFSTYTQDCIDQHSCQKALWFMKDNYDNVRIQHLITIGAKYSLVSDGKGVLSTDNLATTGHPQWSHISVFDAASLGSQPDENFCDPADNTFQKPSGPPQGESYPSPGFTIKDWDDVVDSSKIYVTIVNLTPYTFKLDRTEFCQMDRMDFGDVPPGHVRQNVMDYFGAKGGTNPVDDNGEAYYHIEETGKKFVIMARTHIPDSPSVLRPRIDMGGLGVGLREFKGRGGQRAVNLVITGSDDYGTYYTSMYSPPIGWMQEIKDVIGPRTLNHVVMPGTHDAGMSVIGKYAWLGDKMNTQTQAHNLYDQLRLGSRWIDLRIINCPFDPSAGDYNFHTAHTCWPCDFHVGATGITGTEVVEMVNKFTDEYPGEVIVLWTRYMYSIDEDPKSGGETNEIREFNEAEMKAFYDLLKGIKRRCSEDSLKVNGKKVKFNQMKMEDIMKQNNGEGCVLIMLDPDDVHGSRAQGSLPSEGIFKGTDFMDRWDMWPFSSDRKTIIEKNVNAWSDLRKNGDDFLIGQWIGTYDTTMLTYLGLQELALRNLYDFLFWQGAAQMNPDSFPNVILLDYLGVVISGEWDWDQADHEVRALILGLNLYMVSENCDISMVRAPLRHPKANAREVRESLLVNDTVRVDPKSFSTMKLEPIHEALAKRQQNNCP